MNKRIAITSGVALALAMVAVSIWLMGSARASEPLAPAAEPLQPDQLRRPVLRQPALTGGYATSPGPEQYFYGEWTFANDSPFEYTRTDLEYSNVTGKVYVLGGRLADGSTSGRVWEFDPVTRVYTDTGVDMPVPISNYTIARLVDSGGDEVLVVFGGRPDAGGVIDTVQGYYPATNTTVEFTSDPYPVATTPGGVVVHNNIAYVFGGFDGVSTIADTNLFDITAAAGSRWTAGPALGQARSYIPATVVDGYVYAMGGDGFDGSSLLPLTITERLSTANPTAWDDAGVATMPIACEEAPAFGFDSTSPYDLAGAVVVAGCGQWPDVIDEAMLYDLASDQWDVNFPNLNEARRNHGGAFVPVGDGGRGLPGMWLWGGIQGSDSNVLNDVEFYDVTPLTDFTLLPRSQTVIGDVGWTGVTLGAVNRSGANETFDLDYQGTVPTWTVSGPPTVFVADNDSVTFTFQVSLPTNAACFAFTDVSITGTGQVNTALSDTVSARVQAGGAWSPITNAVTGGHWMSYACTDLYGSEGTCFYFGGLQGSAGSQGVTDTTRIYDIASATWSLGAPLPTAVYAGVAGVIDSGSGPRVYVAGGFDADAFASVTDALQVYNPATNSWTSGPALPLARGGIGGGAVNGKLYVTGGQDTAFIYANLHEYDPVANQWFTRTSHVTVDPGYFPVFFGHATTADKLYIGGDYAGNTTFLEYNQATDSWAQRADLPTTAGQKSPVGAGVGDQVFWFGGDLGAWLVPQDTAWIWDPIRNQWALSYAEMNRASTGNGGGYANGQLWTFGGSQGAGSLEPPPHETAPPCVPPFPPVGAFQGTVRDANTGLGVPNAYLYTEVVTDEDIFAETFADGAGNYQFSGLQLSDYKLIASGKGYRFTLLDGWLNVPTLVPDGIITYNVTLSAPVMAWSETGYTEVLSAGAKITRSLVISNSGTSDLFFSLGSYTQGVLPPPPPNALGADRPRVDPALLDELAASTTGETDIIVVMAEQADLSAAYGISDWEARGAYVFDTLVETANRSQLSLRAHLAALGIAYRPFYTINGLLVRGDLNLLNALTARTDVAYLSVNGEIPLETPRQSLLSRFLDLLRAPAAIEWGVQRVNADDVWSTYGVRGEGIVVANIDTGVEWTHNALVNQYRGGAGDHDYNWYMPTSGCNDSSGPCDNDGHGTHTMGTMVGDDGGNNQIGVAPGADWIACKGCEANSCSFEALLGCADWVVAPCPFGVDPGDPACDPSKRPNVVNNSWGGGGGDFWYGLAVGAWRASGIFPQFSAGNSGPGCSTTGAPGDYWMSYAAAAINSSDQPAGFSSRGPAAVTGILKPDISGPGVNIRSSVPGNTYGSSSGTSMSSPHVAGVVALIWSAEPSLVGQIEDTMWLISQTADPLYTTDVCGGDTPAAHPNHTYGWGMADAKAAVDAAYSGDIAVPWVEMIPSGGQVPAGQWTSVDVVFTGPALPGTYTGTLQLTADEPYSPDVRLPLQVTSNPAPPTAKFSSTSPDFVGEVTQFTNETLGSAPFTFEWDLGDGTMSALENPTRTYALPGVYTVVLTATNGEGSDAFSGSVEILDVPPVAGFQVNANAGNIGDTFVFTNTSTGTNLTYLWDFGDGVKSSAENPTHTYSIGAVYTVTLEASNSAGSDQATASLNVEGPPAASFVSSSPDLLGQTTIFTDTTIANPPAFAWVWTLEPGVISALQHPTYQYSAVGLYDVTLNAFNAKGSNMTQGVVAICNAFVSGASFTVDPATPAAGVAATLNGSVASGDEFPTDPVTYAWDFGDGGTGAGATVTHTFASAGTYTVTMTASGPCGTDTSSQPVQVTAAGAPALYVSKSVDPMTQTPGGAVMYTIVFGNMGGTAASGVVLSDVLPSNVHYAWSNPMGSYNSATHELVWDDLTVTAGARITATVGVTVSANITTSTRLTNTVYLMSAMEPLMAQAGHDVQPFKIYLPIIARNN